MKLLRAFSLLFLLVLPLGAFSQSLTFPQDVDTGKHLHYQPDPLKAQLLEVDNPCTNPRFLALQHISTESLQKNEQEQLQQHQKSCQDYVAILEEPAPAQHSADPGNGIFTPRTTPYIVAGCATVITIIFIVAL